MAKRKYSGKTETIHEEFKSHGRFMKPNNGMTSNMIHEDMSRPCGLPMGALQKDMGDGSYFSMNAYRVGDLYEQVDKNMREDAAAVKTLTKPTNW